MRTDEEIKELRGWLLENEWAVRPPFEKMETCSQVWTKVFPGAQCASNPRGGAPVEVKVFDYDPPFDVEISLRAQKPDGVWVEFNYYSIPGGNLIEQVEAQSSNLVKAWNVAAGQAVPS